MHSALLLLQHVQILMKNINFSISYGNFCMCTKHFASHYKRHNFGGKFLDPCVVLGSFRTTPFQRTNSPPWIQFEFNMEFLESTLMVKYGVSRVYFDGEIWSF